jgi:hypothetical protein
VKISTPRVCTGFAVKEEFRVGEKEFICGSKQIGQNYLRKVQESDRVNLDQVSGQGCSDCICGGIFLKNSH